MGGKLKIAKQKKTGKLKKAGRKKGGNFFKKRY